MTYPNEIKAQALGLMLLGYSSYQAAARLPVKIEPKTLRLWREDALPNITEEQRDRIIANAVEIATRAQKAMIDVLDESTFSKPDLIALNVVAGTAIDKVLKSQEIAKPGDQHLHIHSAVDQIATVIAELKAAGMSHTQIKARLQDADTKPV